jgi:hypothetical protein
VWREGDLRWIVGVRDPATAEFGVEPPARGARVLQI